MSVWLNFTLVAILKSVRSLMGNDVVHCQQSPDVFSNGFNVGRRCRTHRPLDGQGAFPVWLSRVAYLGYSLLFTVLSFPAPLLASSASSSASSSSASPSFSSFYKNFGMLCLS